MPEQDGNKLDEKNKTIKIAVDEITKENVALKNLVEGLRIENDTLKKEMIETDAFLDAQVRAKLSSDLQKISKFSVEDIDHMTTEDIATTLNTLRHSNIMRKPMLATEGASNESDEHFTVGNLFAAPLRPKPEGA
jgi:hypothetical protein